MKNLLIAIAILCSSVNAYSKSFATIVKLDGKSITLSCDRVLYDEPTPQAPAFWDHPDQVFIDSMEEFGYCESYARSMATTICRDRSLLTDDPKSDLKEQAQALISLIENIPLSYQDCSEPENDSEKSSKDKDR